MTIPELIEKLEAEVKRAAAYRPPHGNDSPFGVLYASPDYIKGGNAALNGVIKLLKDMK